MESSSEGNKKALSLKQKAGLAAGTAMTAAAGLFGAVEAADPPKATPTKTATPVPTATPDTISIRIAKAEKDAEDLKRLNEVNAKLDALKQPPTATPNRAATETARIKAADEAYGKERARLREEYDRKHPPATATREPAAVTTPSGSGNVGTSAGNQGGGIPVEHALTGAALILAWFNRGRIMNWFRGLFGGGETTPATAEPATTIEPTTSTVDPAAAPEDPTVDPAATTVTQPGLTLRKRLPPAAPHTGP